MWSCEGGLVSWDTKYLTTTAKHYGRSGEINSLSTCISDDAKEDAKGTNKQGKHFGKLDDDDDGKYIHTYFALKILYNM